MASRGFSFRWFKKVRIKDGSHNISLCSDKNCSVVCAETLTDNIERVKQ